jgi:hypothetical protein
MYKMQIFQEVISEVIDATEIEKEQILSPCKREEVVDARAVLIKLLSEKGLYPMQISRLTGINLRSVTKFLLGFRERIDSRKILRMNYERMRKKLGMT